MKAIALFALMLVGCVLESNEETATVEQGEFCYDEVFAYCNEDTFTQYCASGEVNTTNCTDYGGTCEMVGSTATCSYPPLEY